MQRMRRHSGRGKTGIAREKLPKWLRVLPRQKWVQCARARLLGVLFNSRRCAVLMLKAVTLTLRRLLLIREALTAQAV